MMMVYVECSVWKSSCCSNSALCKHFMSKHSDFEQPPTKRIIKQARKPTVEINMKCSHCLKAFVNGSELIGDSYHVKGKASDIYCDNVVIYADFVSHTDNLCQL